MFIFLHIIITPVYHLDIIDQLIIITHFQPVAGLFSLSEIHVTTVVRYLLNGDEHEYNNYWITDG
jgi:hypothetical protein